MNQNDKRQKRERPDVRRGTWIPLKIGVSIVAFIATIVILVFYFISS